MGKTCSVSEAREYDKGQQLPGLTGKVKVVFQPRQKESSAQPGTTYQDQGIVLCDLANPKLEIVVSLYDHAAYDKSIVGKVMTVTPGPKGGLKSNGSYEKEGGNGQMQTNYTAAASKACDVTFGGGAGAAPASERNYPAQVTGNVNPTGGRATAAPGLSWDEYLEAEGGIYSKCLKKALEVIAANKNAVGVACDTGFEPAQVLAVANTLRISAEKFGLTVDSPSGAPKAAPKPAPRAAVEPEDPGPSDPADDDVAF